MATKISTKNTVTAATPTTTTSAVNNTKILTVIVVDENGKVAEGARVSITPSNASLVTNSAGEVQFKLGDAKKYDVTASYASKTVTVPYYVTPNGATRLVVNPIYVKSIEDKLRPSFFSNLNFVSVTGIVLGLAILFFIIWRFFRRKE